MLAAKAIEDSPLFNGQESSTRYLDFSNQPVISNSTESHIAVTNSMLFFKNLYETEYVYNLEQHGNPTDPVECKAIKAKTFDIVRAFLPVGLSTNVNWCTNLRQVQDHFYFLATHELPEIRDISKKIYALLMERYPESVFPVDTDRFQHMMKYFDEYQVYAEDPEYNEHTSVYRAVQPLKQQIDISYNELDLSNLKRYPSLASRPRGCPLPRIYNSQMTVAGLIDFGSFRDIQRHRNNLCKIPRLTPFDGFEQWYLDNLSPAGRVLAQAEVEKCQEIYKDTQDVYTVLMGFRVPFLLQLSLEQMVYITELRCAKSVHPTARSVALAMADFLDKKIPDVALYADRSPLDTFYLKRANHDITKVA